MKNPLAMWESWVRSLGWEDPLEKGRATHSSSLENAMNCIVNGVTRTWPSDFHFQGFQCVYQVVLHPLFSAAVAAKSLQSCPTLCDPIDGSPPGSPIPGILQARALEWVAISFSNA